MLKKVLGGINTGHSRGFIYKNGASPYYLLMIFRTPFFAVLNGERIEGVAGDVLLHKPGAPVIHGPLSADREFVNDWIYFTDSGDGTLESLPLPYDRIISLENARGVTHLLEYVMEESVRGDVYSPRLISDTIYRILTAVLRSDTREKDEENTIYAQFREARVQILHAYGDPWTLQKMAELTGYSVSRFCALYTEFFGVSPMNDLLNERLNVGLRLLSLHAYKIGDIAEMCGFTSIHYFSRFIKQRTGKRPSEF